MTKRNLFFFVAIIGLAGSTISYAQSAGGPPTPAGKTLAVSPVLGLLDQFTAPDVPVRGPAEKDTPRNWTEPTEPAPVRPGKGLAQHPMLYAGEGHNTLFLVNEGKVIWTYSTGPGGEIDDVWLMSNGNILYARQNFIEEVTPKKQVMWHLDAPKGTEIHSVQPIGYDKVVFIQNGLPPKIIVLNKRTGAVEVEHEVPIEPSTDPKSVHVQFRRMRLTADGTYLVTYLKADKVVEYDRDFKPIWTYEIAGPWAAARLHNRNTLIVSEKTRLVREVNSKGETVWEFKESDLPPEVKVRNIQTAERLASGNTVIFSSTGGTKKEDRASLVQCVEVTPGKKVVWVLQDWKNLGPATTAQFLDEPGLPESPGHLQR